MRFWTVISGLGVAAVLIRASGPVLFANRQLPAWLRGPFALLTPVVLAGLIVVSTFGAGRHLVLDARAAGVAAALVCVTIRVPLLAVMVIAAAVTGVVRLLA